ASINNQLSVNYSGGSYSTGNLNISGIAGNETFGNMIAYTHQSSNGYREHTAMRRDIASWDSKISNGKKESLSTHVLFGDLYYETPGGLTKTQYIANPKSARPASG